MRRQDRGIDEKVAQVRRMTLAIVVFAVPVTYLPGITQEAYNIPKVALLTAGASLALALRIAELGRGSQWRSVRVMAFPAGSLLIPLMVAWAFSSFPGWALHGEHSRQEGLLPYILVVTTGVLVADAFQGRARALCKLLAASGTMVAILALMQAFGLDVAARPLVTYVSGPMGNSNFLGAFLAIILPVAIGTWVFRMWAPLLGMLSTVVIATAILMSFSQGAWLAAPAGVAVVAAARLRNRRRLSIAIAVMTPLLAAAIGVGAVLYSLVQPFGRFSDAGNRTRALWWHSAVAMAADSPVVGHGPNAYAMEAVRYREPLDALELPQIVADGPHSVPISLLASAGLPGILGFFGVVAWALRRSARIWRGPPDDAAIVFVGALASYVVVAFVNDHLMMEFAFWICLGGLTLGGADAPTGSPHSPRSSLRRGATYAVATTVGVAGLVWSSVLMTADLKAQAGIEAFRSQDGPGGRRNLREAISLRDEYVYRQLYATFLGIEALEMREDGLPLVEELDAVLRPLEGWPKLSIRLVHAGALHEWSVFDSRVDEKALDIYRQAHADDPHNPWPILYISDIHLQAGRPKPALGSLGKAIALVERYPQYVPRYVDLWANLAIAHILLDDVTAAEAALGRIDEIRGHIPPSSCRTWLAFQLSPRSKDKSLVNTKGQILSFRCTAAQLRVLSDSTSKSF